MGLNQNSLFYELSISTHSKNVKEAVIEAAILGYHVVALNTIMCKSDDNIKSTKKQNASNPSPPSPLKISFTANDLAKRKIKIAPKLLSRLTIKLHDARDDLDEVLAAARVQYDIVGVAPRTDAALVQCCRARPDLISFDGSSKITALALRQLPAALQSGVYVELQYDACVGSSSASARQACLREHQSVFSAVRGRQLVVSSGTADPGRLRSPVDVVHLCPLLGLSSEAAHNALSRSCADLLHLCERRRRRRMPQPTLRSAAPEGAVVLYSKKKKKRKIFDCDLANKFVTSFSSVKRSKT